MTVTGLPAQTEFTASNGLKVATDIRGAVGVQWGSPRAGGWSFHDPEETCALQEFFAHHPPAAHSAPALGPWQVYLVDGSDGTRVNVYYDAPAHNSLQSMEVPTADLPALITVLQGLIAPPREPGPWKVYPVDEHGDTYVQVEYNGGLLEGGFAGECDPSEVDSLIALLHASKAANPKTQD